MDNYSKIIKGLIKISGKILFILGLVLNICMVFFGFWPSIIYLLFMALGGFMIFTNKDVDTSIDYVFFKQLNFKSIFSSSSSKEYLEKTAMYFVKTTFVILISIIILVSLFFYFSESYFKASNTKDDCKKIVVGLNSYKKDLLNYPANMDSLIGNNPLRKEWKKDGWNNEYYYKSLNNGKNFILISKGKDQKLFTKDDIILKN
jgi:general secretion pathway protein G